MNLKDFYEDKVRLSYNPRNSLAKSRTGLKKLIAYDDRFDEVAGVLNRLTGDADKKEIKILDIGVGDGVYESMLPPGIFKKAHFYGVDISEKQLGRAKKYLIETKLVDLNKETLPYASDYFDICIVSEILEHVFYPEKVLNEAFRVLKKRGKLILTYPNSGSLQLRLSLFLTGASPLLNYPQNKEHIRFFNKDGIFKMLPPAARLESVQGLGSFIFAKWNFLVKIVTPRVLQIVGNRLLPNLALGHLMILKK